MKVLATIISRQRHEAIVHNKIKPFECELCQNRFVKSNLEGHKRSFHNFPKLKCEHYEAQFCYAFSLNEHKKKCNRLMPFSTGNGEFAKPRQINIFHSATWIFPPVHLKISHLALRSYMYNNVNLNKVSYNTSMSMHYADILKAVKRIV